MNRYLLKPIVVIFLVAGILFSQVGSAQARKFGGSSADYEWAVEKVCRDGAQVVAIWWSANAIQAAPLGYTTFLYTNHSLPVPDLVLGNNGPIPHSAFGPRLAGTEFFITQHNNDELYTTQADDSGFHITPNTAYDRYGIGQFLWGRRLEVGAEVVFRHFSQYIFGVVEDCYINPPALATGDSKIIGQNDLAVPTGIAPAELLYTLESAPAHGSLSLNSTPLSAGDHFSQADINSDALTYSHDGNATPDDQFTFSVQGTGRVSTAVSGQPNGVSSDASLSADGLKIAFESTATNLVGGDPFPITDVFLKDLLENETQRISFRLFVSSPTPTFIPVPSTNPALSSNGGRVGVISNGNIEDNPAVDTYRRSNSSQAIDVAELQIVFDSDRDDLFGGTDANNALDVFWQRWPFAQDPTDLETVSVTNFNSTGDGPSRNPAIAAYEGLYIGGGNANGYQYIDENEDELFFTFNTHVAFQSDATNLLELGIGPTTALAAAMDTNNATDIFVASKNGPNDYTLRRVSVSSSGAETEEGGHSITPSISGDGRYIAFASIAANLVARDGNGRQDIFVHDRDVDGDGIFDEGGQRKTVRVSVASDGAEADRASFDPVISANGRFVAFASNATNLVDNDNNNARDIFLHDRDADEDGLFDEPGAILTRRVSVASDGTEADGPSFRPSISFNGEAIAFDSDATNLVADDSNGLRDVFVHYTGFTSAFPLIVNPLGLPLLNKTYLPVVVKN